MAQAQDEQAALNEVMQLLEATPDTAAPTGIANLGLPANDARSWPCLFRLASPKRPSACSSHTNGSNACPTRTWRSTTNGRKPTSAAKPPSP